MSKDKINWQMTFIFCFCILVVINVFVIVKLILVLGELREEYPSRANLPCGAIPIRFVLEEPECANKLLISMNVTNVHISSDKTLSSLWSKTNLRLRNTTNKQE
jgi:hypothetical protein